MDEFNYVVEELGLKDDDGLTFVTWSDDPHDDHYDHDFYDHNNCLVMHGLILTGQLVKFVLLHGRSTSTTTGHGHDDNN